MVENISGGYQRRIGDAEGKAHEHGSDHVPAVQVSPVAIPTVQRENTKVEKLKDEEPSKLED